jgi:alpha-mannosidase
MTDEAASHYWDMIDQLIEGHQFLKSSIGLTQSPVNGYSIDPFGHGSTLPYLLQKAGISNTLIQRTHFAWKQYLASKQQLDFVWKQMFQIKTKASDLFCHMQSFDLYSIKFTCGPNTDICLQFDFRKIAGEFSESTSVVINEENIEERAELMLGQFGRLASVYPHNTALVLLGDDFRFNYDIEWEQQYNNYKLLFDHINSNKNKYNNTDIMFGTLNDFFTEVHKRMKRLNGNKYPKLVGDFMPYADIYADSKPNYWTGFYTTRPFWKSLSRELQHWLRSAEILYSFARNLVRQNGNIRMSERLDKDYMFLTTARENLALFQHHDAITGTSKEAVMEDYGMKLNRAIIETMGIISHSVQFLLLKDHSTKPPDLNAAHPMTAYLFPDIQRPVWDGLTQKIALSIPPVDGRKIVVFNSFGQSRIESIKVHVKNPIVRVINAEDGNELDIQINPIFNTSAAISTRVYEIEFIATLSPLSLTTYIIERRHSKDHAPKKVKISMFLNDANDDEQKVDLNGNNLKVFHFDNPYDKDFELETPYIKAQFDHHTGFLTSIYNKKLGIKRTTHLSFMAYKSADFYSGAYLFKPSQFDPMQNITERFPLMRLIRGEITSQLTVIYPNFIEVSFKVYHSEGPIGSAVEFECSFDIGKRPDLTDWEIVMRIQTDVETVDTKSGQRSFYVDSNGFQMIQRKYNEELGVEANYYPMTTAMYIEDNKSRVTLLSSHSHGVTSPLDGLMEVMLERRIRYDDNRGLSEGILDNKLTVSRFMITIEGLEEDIRNEETIVPNLSRLLNSLTSTLLYPPILLASDGIEDRPLHSNLSLIDNPFDCDLFLVNFRTLPDINNFSLPSLSSLLIVHNKGNSCRVKQHISPSSLLCDKPKNKVTKLLHIKVQSINECSLTAMKSYQHINDLSAITVPQMEINAYNISFVK